MCPHIFKVVCPLKFILAYMTKEYSVQGFVLFCFGWVNLMWKRVDIFDPTNFVSRNVISNRFFKKQTHKQGIEWVNDIKKNSYLKKNYINLMKWPSSRFSFVFMSKFDIKGESEQLIISHLKSFFLIIHKQKHIPSFSWVSQILKKKKSYQLIKRTWILKVLFYSSFLKCVNLILVGEIERFKQNNLISINKFNLQPI